MALRGCALEQVVWLVCSIHCKTAKAELQPQSGEDSEQFVDICPLCGRSGDLGFAGCCGTCWLGNVDGDSQRGVALRALSSELDDGWHIAEQLQQIRTAQSGPSAISADASVANSGQVVILWDSHDRRTATIARALYHGLGAMVNLIEIHQAGAVDALLDRQGSLPKAKILRPGGLSAILPEGVFINGCEHNQKVLFYELLYRKTLVPATISELDRIECRYLEPLRVARQLSSQGNALTTHCQWWWEQDHALKTIGGMLGQEKFALIDGFLQEDDLNAMMEQVRAVLPQMQRGILQGGHGPYWGDEHENQGDFLNAAHEPRQWTIRGDNLFFAKDGDARAAALCRYTRALDVLIRSLSGPSKEFAGKQVAELPAGPAGDAARRLRHADFRQDTMCACYRGDQLGRYAKHLDGRHGKEVLTAILYLNEDWTNDDGGLLRLYFPGMHSTAVKYDVSPVKNRLLLFWATEENPHEVLFSHRDRFASTVWYFSGRSCLSDAAGLHFLFQNMNPVGPSTLLEALRGAADGDEALARRLLQLAAFRRSGGVEGNDEEFKRFAASHPICSACSQVSKWAVGTEELRKGAALAAAASGNDWWCSACCASQLQRLQS